MAKDTYLKKVLGPERYDHIRNANVLMVGAGGIGCELLKDLLLTGYGTIQVVDLDTITLSNLNRQFLFRQKDIDKSKSLTVVKAVEKFNYFNCKLVPHHGNIMNDDQFPLSWWNQFDYIYNALDNLEARRYVNKMCLFLLKPLMESGTTGYEGQVQPILPYKSECFDCQAKATPKTFPVCTIRSTPSQPIHSITWAKEFLFQQLFEQNLTLSDAEVNEQRKMLEQETDSKQEIENLLKETNELNDLKLLITKDLDSFFRELIKKIFISDIERLLKIESLWKFRSKPVPLDFNSQESSLNKLVEDQESSNQISQLDTKIWDILENLYVLFKASKDLANRVNQGENIISFDKDDETTLDFVTAAANLRCYIFHIEVKSKFDIKQIAGNIIPAIATTNAIISGFSGLESLSYFKSMNQDQAYNNSSTVFISIKYNKYVTPASLVPSNEKCASCSLSSRGILTITNDNLQEMTLQNLIDKILSQYNYNEISIILGKSKLIYDMDFDDNVDQKLVDLGLTSGQELLIQDDDDELENLELLVNAGDSFHLPQIKIRDKKIIEPPQESQPEVNESSNGEIKDLEESNINNDNNNIIELNDEIEVIEDGIHLKEEEPPSKKQKTVKDL